MSEYLPPIRADMFGIDRHYHALAAEFYRRLAHQIWPSHGR